METEINKAIEIAVKSKDLQIQKNWQRLSVDGRVPTAQELISILAEYILKNYMAI